MFIAEMERFWRWIKMNRNNRGNIYYLYPNFIANKILHELLLVTFDYWWKSNFTACNGKIFEMD